MLVLQSRLFKNSVKRLHGNQKHALDNAVRAIVANPAVGKAKAGDLAGIRVYKFKMTNQLTLLAYEWTETEEKLEMLAFGSHENFYRDLKR
ncbi:MAG: type II toxin-antitoxin system RelE/ParE family toxin [Magnetococcales bacterium]|nr:type II toxin-antitoxin system RelE/ParE family toxin [Magnetococcales bacterium]